MHDYDYCECNEKHLADLELSEEFYEKIDKLIAEESKKYIKNETQRYKWDLESRDNKIKEFEQRTTKNEKEFSQLQENIKNLKIRLIEKDNIIEELNTKIHSMSNKFLINDTSFYIDYENEYPECPECGGNKKVKVIYKESETELTCPVCEGNRYKNSYRKYFVKEVQIKSILFHLNGISYDHRNSYSDWFFEDQKKFFKTKEEAETECKKLNKKEEEKICLKKQMK
jgi:Zn finger protein HypA/HybF involved in hydrogenase expression